MPENRKPPAPADLARNLRRDGPTAYRALWALAAERDKALPILKPDLLAEDKPDAERINRLIGVLDDPDPEVRDTAMRALRQIGSDAEPPLRKAPAAANSDKLRARLRGLLADLEGDGTTGPASALYATRVVDLLDLIGTTEARKLLETLAREGRTSQLRDEAKAALAGRR